MIWRLYFPDTPPLLDGSPVLLAVWCEAIEEMAGGRWVRGEAYYLAGRDNESENGWWWANTGPGDYTAERLETNFGEPNPATWRWRPFPEVPEKPPAGV